MKINKTILSLTFLLVLTSGAGMIFLMVGYVDSTKIEEVHTKISDLVFSNDNNETLLSLDDVGGINSISYQKILDSCDDPSNFEGLIFYNGTHYIDNFICEWELTDCDLMDILCLERSIPEYLNDTKENNFDKI